VVKRREFFIPLRPFRKNSGLVDRDEDTLSP